MPPLPRPVAAAPGAAAVMAARVDAAQPQAVAQRTEVAPPADVPAEPPLVAWVRLVLAAVPEVAPQRAAVVALAACLERSAPTDTDPSHLRAPLLRQLDAFCAGALAGESASGLLRPALGEHAEAAVLQLPALLSDVLELCDARPGADAQAPLETLPPQPPPAQPLATLPPSLAALTRGAALATLMRDALSAPALLARGQRGVHAGGTEVLDFGLRRVASTASPYAALMPPPQPRVLHRALRLVNSSAAPVVLLSLRLEPASSAFCVLEDFELAVGGTQGVLLPPGASYECSVQLTAAPDSAGGLLAAWLLATLAEASAPERGAFVVGRRIAAAVLTEEHARCVQRCSDFNPEARPFVPAALRTLFDAPAAVFLAPPGAPPGVVGAWLHSRITAVSACCEHPTTAPLPLALRTLARLLRLEEAAQARALHAYDRHDAVLTAGKSGQRGLWFLEVPGLPENRPAVSLGDHVHLRSAASPRRAEVAARVLTVQVSASLIGIQLWPEALVALDAYAPPAVPRMSVKVHCRFALDRTLLLRMSEALLSVAASLEKPGLQLLPEAQAPPWTPPAVLLERSDLQPCEPPLNAQQADAVLAVLNGHADGAPHVLYGPPGTGKTLTVVEAARQLLLLRPQARLLLCAPSPFAADILCSRLAAVTDSGVVRVNDPRRAAATIKTDVLPHCLVWLDGGDVQLPVRQRAPRVLVATCASAALLRHAPALAHLLPFDAVFLDEAGQATAAESLIPLAAPLTAAHTAILLAGDPRQLGPVLHSRAAVAGLGRSLLERFADAASGTDGRRRRVTHLLCNYRSHPDVLALPSQLFYRAELQPCADAASTSLPASWLAEHAGGHCRVHFHGVRGVQRRDADAPSWYNAHEAAAVVDAVTALLAHGLAVGDVGVIATFRRQVQKIRDLLRARGLGAIRVGTVDDYQGQQEKIIVISTVITRAGDAGGDDALGFLANPRRFNVAVSRAQALNVVIGHPVPLATWPHWDALLRQALARGVYTGAGAAALGGEAEDDDLGAAVARLAELTLLGAGHAEEPVVAGGGDDFYGDECGWKVAL